MSLFLVGYFSFLIIITLKKTTLRLPKYLNSFIRESFDIFSSAVKDNLFSNLEMVGNEEK